MSLLFAAAEIRSGFDHLWSPTALAVLVVGVTGGWISSWVAHRYAEAPPGDEHSSDPTMGFAALGEATCSACGSVLDLADVAPPRFWASGGACPDCHARQPATWWLAQLSVPILSLAMLATWGSTWILIPFLWLVPVLVTAAVIDLRTMLIPKDVVWAGFLVGAVLIITASVLEGVTSQLVPAMIGAVGYFGFLFVVSIISPAGMGFGDVRLAALLGLYLGWIHMLLPAIGLFIACLFGVVLGLGVRVASGAKKAPFPFGPGLALGTMVAIVGYEPLLHVVLSG